MPNISHINNKAIANVAAFNGKTLSDIGEVNTLTAATGSSFADSFAVARSITTGTAQAVYIADSDGHFNFTHSQAYTI